MSEFLRGVVVSFRRGPRTQRPKEYLIQFRSVESVSEAGQLIGRKVAWPLGQRNCIGKVVALQSEIVDLKWKGGELRCTCFYDSYRNTRG